MAYFGLSSQNVIDVARVTYKEFNSPKNISVDNGQTVLESIMDRAYGVVMSYIPQSLAKRLEFIDYEIVEQEADSGQTTFTLAADISDTSELIVWKYASGEDIRENPKKSDRETSGYSCTSDGVITFDTAFSVGEQLLASYPTGLIDDCPSLANVLRELTLYYAMPHITSAERREIYTIGYDRAMEFLSKIEQSEAGIYEIDKIDFLKKSDFERKNKCLSLGFRNPA